MNKKLLASLFAVGLAAGCVCSSVDAHGVFFANRTDEKVLVLGEGPVDNAYSADMVKNITGYDVQGKQIPVQVVKHEKNYRFNDKFASVDRLRQSIIYWPEKRRKDQPVNQQ